MLHESFIYVLVGRHTNMSDMLCHDSFIGSWEFHGSYIHFRVHIRVCIASCDMVECGMMWKIILLHLYRTYICTGLMFAFKLEIEMKCKLKTRLNKIINFVDLITFQELVEFS